MKPLFDAIRAIKGAPLTQAEVDRINAVLPATSDQPIAPDDVAPDAPPPAGPAKTIENFIAGYIDAHEGGLSMRASDNGNWTGGRRGLGRLVGSKFGVTPAALAAYRGVPVDQISASMMANLTRTEAITIGATNYYRKPGFSTLPWNRVTLSIVDKGWGSGPAQAIKLMQRMIGVKDDGQIGPATRFAYENWLRDVGEEEGARRWAKVRRDFDYRLTTNEGPNDPDKIFLNGWNNRTDSFLPGTKWWSAWGP